MDPISLVETVHEVYLNRNQYIENMIGSGQMNSIKTIMGLIEGCVSSEKKETEQEK